MKRPFIDYTDDDWDDFISNALANFVTIGVILIVVLVWTSHRPRIIRAIVEAS